MEAIWRKSIPDQGDNIPGMYKEAKSGISRVNKVQVSMYDIILL